MGPNYYQTGVKYGKVFFLATVLVVALSECTLAQSKINCRIRVFAPECRGIAAKRDTQSHTFPRRFTPPSDESDYFADSERTSSTDDVIRMNGIIGLLRRAISKNVENDMGSNYLV